VILLFYINTTSHREDNMDNLKSQIPINTRTIGTPQGIYLLYIEDYVHTFIQKNIEHNKNAIKIALYGRSVEENGTISLVISGAALSKGNVESDKDIGTSYFKSCTYLGIATSTKDVDNNLHFEIYSCGIINLIDDYYIYYDQNDEMQNYLISWNSKFGEPNKARTSRSEDVARYGKILQAYNKEEAKVSFMWNMMNVLCLGFAVCFLAFGIITINNYSKMQSIQYGIDYCMKMLDMQLAYNEIDNEIDDGQDDKLEYEQNTENETVEETSHETDTEIDTESQETQEVINSDIPTYYIVQKGDTLRTICMEIYGDYDYVEKICLWNDIEDPNNILCGQKLLLR
jgi:hypothetical protein